MVWLEIPYETLVSLVERLPEQRKRDLLRLLQASRARPLSKEQKLVLYHASILSVPVNEAPSIRRDLDG